jgi:hypothetical protein
MSIDTKSIRERAERATPGPWEDQGGYYVRSRSGDPQFDCKVGEGPRENVGFIAAARTDVPALCDAVDSLRAALAQAERERDEALATVKQVSFHADGSAFKAMLAVDAQVKAKLDNTRRETFEAVREAAARWVEHHCGNLHYLKADVAASIRALTLADIDQAPGTTQGDDTNGK